MTPTNRAWLETVVDVLNDGIEFRQEDRVHAPTKEVLCHTVAVPMDAPVMTLAARKLDYRIMCAEVAAEVQRNRAIFADIATTLARGGATYLVVMEPPGAALQWLIRDGVLHCISMMQLSDVWLNLPSTLHIESALSAHLALVLKKHHGLEVELGWLHNTAGSRRH